MKNIAIFGGTFDPIHNGHLNLANSMFQRGGLDEIWFCPVRYSPHKVEGECSPVEDRFKMVQLAIEGYPKYKVVDFEIKRDGPSYTVDTLEELREKYPDTNFYLIIGDDSVKGFFKWKEPEKIVQLARLLVGTRVNEPLEFPANANKTVVEAIRAGVVETPIVEVSSTEIRNRVRQRKNLEPLLPQKVVDYIIANGLYSDP